MEESDRGERRPGWRASLHAYLPDVVYGANDGLVTTFAIVSGVVGGGLGSRVILILGFASLLADGISMGASNYLSARSQRKQGEMPGRLYAARHGGVTFSSFVLAGLVPLVSYLLPLSTRVQFPLAGTLTVLTLFGIGSARSAVTRRPWLRSGLEMMLVGTGAAAVAYAIGAGIAVLTGQQVAAA